MLVCLEKNSISLGYVPYRIYFKICVIVFIFAPVY